MGSDETNRPDIDTIQSRAVMKKLDPTVKTIKNICFYFK